MFGRRAKGGVSFQLIASVERLRIINIYGGDSGGSATVEILLLVAMILFIVLATVLRGA